MGHCLFCCCCTEQSGLYWLTVRILNNTSIDYYSSAHALVYENAIANALADRVENDLYRAPRRDSRSESPRWTSE